MLRPINEPREVREYRPVIDRQYSWKNLKVGHYFMVPKYVTREEMMRRAAKASRRYGRNFRVEGTDKGLKVWCYDGPKLRTKYPWKTMKVGDSFHITKSFWVTASRAGKKYGRKFAVKGDLCVRIA